VGLLDEILAERPAFHRGEVEVQRPFDASESMLERGLAESVAKRESVCWGIDPAVAHFIFDSLSPEARTLETGAGISTLVFALRGAKHTAITPNRNEIDAIAAYAARKGIDLSRVTFVAEASEHYLPRVDAADLDLVLIDGKHAFPWPVIDWFFTVDHVREGGLLLLDDVQLYSVRMLCDFMQEDPAWSLRRRLTSETYAFEKLTGNVLDVAWHMQPYVWKRSQSSGRRSRARALLRRIPLIQSLAQRLRSRT
jgi:hypothetical protein